MTPEQFEAAVNAGYERLLFHARCALENGSVFEPKDVLHNTLLEFRVKRLTAFEWQSQEAWESHIRARITGDVLNFHLERAAALDFRDFERLTDDEVGDDAPSTLDVLVRLELEDALPRVLRGLRDNERQVVLGCVAGLTQEQIGSMLGVGQPRVSQILHRARKKAQAFLDAGGYS